MHFLKAQTLKGSNLEHERSESGSTNEGEASLDGTSSTGGLGESRGAGAVGSTGGRGAERAGNGHGASGLDDGAVVDRGAGAGDVGGDGLDGGGVRSNDGGLDGRRRSDRVTGSGARLDGVSSGGGGWGNVTSGAGARSGRRGAGRSNNGAVLLGDTELSGVLVLAGNVVDELKSVVGGVSLEGGRRGPGEGTRVVDALSKSLDGDNVGRGATEQEERDRVGGGWLPGDGEGLASGDNLRKKSVTVFQCLLFACDAYLVQRTGDGVASGLADRGVELRSGNAGEESDDGGLGEHVDGFDYVILTCG